MIKTPFGKLKTRGQAMVEFAVALPVLLLVLYGIMEFGRAVLIYALVNNASRDAVRYASAYGKSDAGNDKYRDCAGIIAVATKSAYIVPITMAATDIAYDTGPGIAPYGTCSSTISVAAGDRVSVTVHASYTPIIHIKLFDLGSTRTFTSTSSRTILGLVKLDNYP